MLILAMALPGNNTEDPAFGLPAVWIETEQRELAQSSGYTVVDASTVSGNSTNAAATLAATGFDLATPAGLTNAAITRGSISLNSTSSKGITLGGADCCNC